MNTLLGLARNTALVVVPRIPGGHIFLPLLTSTLDPAYEARVKELEEQNEKRKEELSEKDKTLAQLREQLEKAQAQHADEKAKLQTVISEKTAEVEEASKGLLCKTSELQTLQADLTAKDQELERLRATVSERVRQISQLEVDVQQLRQQMTAREAAYSSLKDSAGTLMTQLDRLSADVRKQDERKDAEAKLLAECLAELEQVRREARFLVVALDAKQVEVTQRIDSSRDLIRLVAALHFDSIAARAAESDGGDKYVVEVPPSQPDHQQEATVEPQPQPQEEVPRDQVEAENGTEDGEDSVVELSDDEEDDGMPSFFDTHKVEPKYGVGMVELTMGEDELKADRESEAYRKRKLRWPAVLDYFEGAKTGDLERVVAYLENYGDIDRVDPKGSTALHYAAQLGHVPVVTYLVEHGANVNVANFEHCTPLHYAVIEEDFDIALYLVEQGHANVTPTDYDGKTPMDLLIDPPQELEEAMLRRLKEETGSAGDDGYDSEFDGDDDDIVATARALAATAPDMHDVTHEGQEPCT
eukprot:comp23807_c0_seq1/m.41415 comp23807_c0_seq1/g.41415  ORF comp23807_c0_seq1/g.41415 comp23807_c0_seq1/m.41415 type:complete len:529 (-) comp23807_c0_seq1:39-1625(-)